MAERHRGLSVVARDDWLDSLIKWGAERRGWFNVYLSWHCERLKLCRILWWGAVPVVVFVLVWWLRR